MTDEQRVEAWRVAKKRIGHLVYYNWELWILWWPYFCVSWPDSKEVLAWYEEMECRYSDDN